MEIGKYNRKAWDHQVENGNRWTQPVTPEAIDAARRGDWGVVLTPEKKVPRDWFPSLDQTKVLGLASGGGQQVPILAAAGADVTCFDNSPKQLQQDELVCQREGLSVKTVLGDMRDLSMFEDDSFDLIFNPCSLSFIPDVTVIFEQAHRILRPGGRMMCGFTNPVRFLFDETDLEAGTLRVRHRLPYADETHLKEEELEKLRSEYEPFLFSHTLESIIGGQLHAGMKLISFFEDRDKNEAASEYLAVYFATLAEKPTRGSSVD